MGAMVMVVGNQYMEKTFKPAMLPVLGKINWTIYTEPSELLLVLMQAMHTLLFARPPQTLVFRSDPLQSQACPP